MEVGGHTEELTRSKVIGCNQLDGESLWEAEGQEEGGCACPRSGTEDRQPGHGGKAGGRRKFALPHPGEEKQINQRIFLSTWEVCVGNHRMKKCWLTKHKLFLQKKFGGVGKTKIELRRMRIKSWIRKRS